jgi:RNA recognition motif-containing protein
MLQAVFERVGIVHSVKIAMDRETGDSKGFAFIEMVSTEAAQEAINTLNKSHLEGKEIIVDFQNPNRSKNKPSRPHNAFSHSGGGQYGQSFSNYADRW